MNSSHLIKSASKKRNLNLAIGIACIVIAVVGVSFVIQQNNKTEKFLVAATDLPAGSTLGVGGTKPIEVNLGDSAENYLTISETPNGMYLLGPVRAGQLIAKSMLASTVIDERVPVVIESNMGLPSGLISGSSVDLWVAPTLEDKTFGEPFALVVGAEVARLIDKSEFLAKTNPAVELWVPIEAVGPILSSIAAEDNLSLILRPTLAEANG